MFLSWLFNGLVLKVAVVGGVCVGGYYAYSTIKSPASNARTPVVATDKDFAYIVAEYLEDSKQPVNQDKKLIDESSDTKSSNFHCKISSTQIDLSCALYRLNSDSKEKQIISLPKAKLTDKDKLVNKSELVKGNFYILKLEKTVFTSLTRHKQADETLPEKIIHLIDAEDATKSFGTMSRVVNLENLGNRVLDTQKFDTFITRLKSKAEDKDLEAKAKDYSCKFGLIEKSLPCSIHKFSASRTSNNFTHADLKGISQVNFKDSGIQVEDFLIVKLKNPKDGIQFGKLKNESIEVNLNTGAKAKQATLIYDQSVFGSINGSKATLLPLKANTKRFLVTKGSTTNAGGVGTGVGSGGGTEGQTATQTAKTVSTDSLNLATKNYRCKYVSKANSATKLDNYDDSCILTKISAKTNENNIFDHVAIAESLSVTANQTFKFSEITEAEKYMVLEIDENKIYNIPDIDAEESNIEIEVVPTSEPATQTFGNVKLEHDVTEKQAKGGKTKLLLAQVTDNKTLTTAATDKCKWSDTETSTVDCDLFATTRNTETELKKLAFNTTKLAIPPSTTFTADQYYLIKLSQEQAISELSKKKFIYFNAQVAAPAVPGGVPGGVPAGANTSSQQVKLKIISLVQGDEASDKRLFYI